MSADDDSTLSDTIIDKLTPTTADGIPLVWSSDNDAHLEGILFEVGKFFKSGSEVRSDRWENDAFFCPGVVQRVFQDSL